MVKPNIGSCIPFVSFPRRFSGFTLVELLVTIAVLSILSALAVPGFLSLVRDNRLTSAANELINDTQIARTEAVRRNLPVVICKTDNPSAANPDCNSAALWTDGWIVFVDSNNNGSRANTEPLVRVHGPLLNTVTLTGAGGPDVENFIIYRPSGRPLAFAGGSFTLCDERGVSKAKALIVSVSGQVRISSGNPIACP